MTSCGAAGRRALCVLLLVFAAFGATMPARTAADGRRVVAQVVRVSDGDTLVARLAKPRPGLKQEETVRLVGIDCPESGQAPWGSRAADRLTTLVLRRPVILEVAIQARDRFGRLLAPRLPGRRHDAGAGAARARGLLPDARHPAERRLPGAAPRREDRGAARRARHLGPDRWPR